MAENNVIDDIKHASKVALWSKLLMAILAAVGGGLALPPLTLLIYSISFGLPYFELIETFGEHSRNLFAVSVIMMLMAILFLMFPGFLKMGDPATIPDRVDGWSTVDVSRFALRRWLVTLGLGYMLGYFAFCVAVFFYAELDKPWLVAALVLPTMMFAIAARWALGGPKLNTALISEKVLKAQLSNAHLGYAAFLVAVGICAGGAYGFLGISVADAYVSNLVDPLDVAGDALSGAFAGGMAAGLFFVLSYWGARRSFINTAIAVLSCIIILLLVYPGANLVIGNTLSLVNQGGGKRVVLELDSDTAESWPELVQDFQNPEALEDKRSVRTKELQLVLLAKTKVFVVVPRVEAKGDDVRKGEYLHKDATVMLDRSEVKGMAFISSRKEKNRVAP